MAQQNNRFDLSQYLQTSQRKSYFIGVVTVAFIAIVVLAGILPAYSAIALQSSENEKRDEGIDQLEQLVGQYQNFIAEEEAEANVLRQFNTSFPEEDYQDRVIEDMSDFTQRADVDLQSISFSDIQREVDLTVDFEVRPIVDYQQVNIRVVGSRQGLLELIDQIERSRTIYNIVSTSITRLQGIQGVDIIEGRDFRANIVIEYYWTDTTLLDE